jgi:hypothetical protein
MPYWLAVEVKVTVRERGAKFLYMLEDLRVRNLVISAEKIPSAWQVSRYVRTFCSSVMCSHTFKWHIIYCPCTLCKTFM